MPSKEDLSENRRNQILDAATKVFTRQGFDKARMDDIVQESSLSKGTLYWYFKSKNDIIYAILDRIFDYEVGAITKRLDQNVPASEQLKQFNQLMVDDFNKMMPLMPLMYDFFALGLRQRKVRKFMGAYLHKFINVIVPIIEQGIQDGEFQANEPKEVAMTIGAVVEGTILLWAYDPEGVEIGKQVHAGMDLMLKGLLVKEYEQNKGEHDG